MKGDQELRELIRSAIDDCTRGIDEAPSLRIQIAQNAKGEEQMAKKISTSLILVVALIVISVTAGLAAGLGLFGELAADRGADDRLPALEEISEVLNVSLTTKDGLTVEIGQAYYVGNRVFISYRVTGSLAAVTLHEGAPEEGIQWSDVLENFVAAEQWVSDTPEIQQAHLWLNGEGQRWAETEVAFLHDGLCLEDGTYLDIFGGGDVVQPDGSIIGWKECEIPDDKLADTLTFKAMLGRQRQVIFQDGSTFMRRAERGETTDVLFTLHRNDRFVYLKGETATPYRAQAELASSQVDLRGVIRVAAPEEWVQALKDSALTETPDMIIYWNLYQNGSLVSDRGTQSLWPEDNGVIAYEQLYPRMTDLDGLTLIPEYAHTGEHPEEAVSIQTIQ